VIDRDITAHIWSTRFDRDRDELAALQPGLAREIARAAEQAIAAAERRHALHGAVEAFGPWRLYQRGLWHSWRCTPADNAEARRLFQRAIEADPAFAAGHAALAMTPGTSSFSRSTVTSEPGSGLLDGRPCRHFCPCYIRNRKLGLRGGGW
jgi:adenylate cyclase